MSNGIEVNKAGLAETFGVTLPTVNAWMKKGAPFIEMGGAGKQWLLNTADISRWREQQAMVNAIGDSRDMDFDEARRRKTAAEASMAELELAVQKGELVEIESVADTVGQDYANCRAKLLNITARLIGELTQDQCDMIDGEIREALTELAAYVG